MEKQTKKAQNLAIWPDLSLTKKAKPVVEFNQELTQDVIDLFLAMKELNGLGLSACQIGDPRAYFVYKVGDKEGVMINPSIIGNSGELKHESSEGCLSFPRVYVKVERYNHVTVRYQDEEGQEHEEQLIGLLGDCVQHEIDHMNGKVIVHYLSKLKRDIVTKKLTKLQKRITRRAELNAEL